MSGRASATACVSGSTCGGGLQPAGKLLEREEHAAREHHRRDREREVVHEEIVARRKRGHHETQAREREPGEKHHRQHPQRERRGDEPERRRDEQHRGAREQRLARGPHRFADAPRRRAVTGAFMIASQVRCTCMREKLEYIASNDALIIVLEHTVPAARNAMYGMPPTSGSIAPSP